MQASLEMELVAAHQEFFQRPVHEMFDLIKNRLTVGQMSDLASLLSIEVQDRTMTDYGVESLNPQGEGPTSRRGFEPEENLPF
jgi:hypothetical protein